MEMKDLNKHQLILLAILLSFVTSIATGITTVTLMEQAPPSIIQPISKVIRETIEKVVPDTRVNTQTVIIKEEDLIVDAISKNQSAVFSVYQDITGEDGKTSQIYLGKSFILSSDGLVATDASVVSEKGSYLLENDSRKFKAEFVSADKNGISFLKAQMPDDAKDKKFPLVSSLGDPSKMKPGQTMIVLGDQVISGFFSGFKEIKNQLESSIVVQGSLPDETKKEVPINSLAVNFNISKAYAGSPVVNLDGEIVGIVVYGDSSVIMPIPLVQTAMKTLSAPKAQ